MLNRLIKLSESQVIGLLTFVAILIAGRVMYIQHGWINDDSTLYMEIAKRFSIGQYREGWELFKWPFYPLLIAWTHKVTTLNLHVSAQLLSIIFYSISTFGLIRLTQLAGGNQHHMLTVALVLFSSPYITGDVLAMLLRDQGFWAFFLLSLVFFIRYIHEYRPVDAAYWQICILLATLFRIEAITYAAILPVYLLTKSNHTIPVRFRHFLLANCFSLLLLICAMIFLATHHYGWADLGRLQEIAGLFSSSGGLSLIATFNEKSHLFAQILGSFLDDYAKTGLFITLLSITLIKSFKVAGPLSAVLMLAARKQMFTLPNKATQTVLQIVTMIAILNATVIIFRSFVLSSRYLVAFGFIIILFASFHLTSLWQSYQTNGANRWQKLILGLAAILIALGIIKNLSSKRDDYNYEQLAVAWVKQHRPNQNIFFGSARLRYYADVPWAGRGDDVDPQTLVTTLNQSEVPPYDCLVVRAEAEENTKLALFTSLKHFEEIQRFSNKAGNQILVLCRKGM